MEILNWLDRGRRDLAKQSPRNEGRTPNRESMYTTELLNDAFGDWRALRLAAYEREVQEGRGHSGQSALIDLVVEKPNI